MTNPTQTPVADESAAAGKAQRTRVPRSMHAAWEPSPERADPLALLAQNAAGRLPALLPIRNARMFESPFAFFRGSAVVMAHDLARTPVTGTLVQACGDAHLLNFGGFATPERNVIFDLNDFDETYPAPWEWDVKRLVTSFVLAGRHNAHRSRATEIAALAAVRAYRLRMREFAGLPALVAWYARLDATKILDQARSAAQKHGRGTILGAAATDSIVETAEKLTTGTGAQRRFRDEPPLLFHAALTEREGFDIEHILASYAATLRPDVAHLLGRYRPIDHAVKVVGVGSVGTRCGIALYRADDNDLLLLQIKEATSSVLAPFAPPAHFASQGERVVRGQRLMQAASDIFLGWASSGTHDFYVRQFKDMKATAEPDGATPADLREYAQYCGWALAAAHARSGNAATIAGYMGNSNVFDNAIVRFAFAYARQSERDYEALVRGVESGEIPVVTHVA